jgi:hypothetical protein
MAAAFSLNSRRSPWKTRGWLVVAGFASVQSLTRAAKFRAWSIRYGSDGKPSRAMADDRPRMVIGVE